MGRVPTSDIAGLTERIDLIRGEPNPMRRARLATEMINELQNAVDRQLNPIRRSAIDELAERHGWTDTQIGAYLNVSRSRIGQIRKRPRTAEASCSTPESSPRGSCSSDH